MTCSFRSVEDNFMWAFNVVRFPSERSGDSRMRQAMREFLEFIFDLNLVDIPLMGGAFTWSNNHTWSRFGKLSI